MREKSKRLQMVRLSSMMMTMAGPDMKEGSVIITH
jgi:hypothetical protein